MIPRTAHWFRRQHPDVIDAIRAEPGDEWVYVGRADNWAAGWVCRIYGPAPTYDGVRPLLTEVGDATPLGAFRAAVAVVGGPWRD